MIPHKSQAQFDTEITADEKAVIAFFRAAGTSPDYEFWIKTTPGYEATPHAEREQYLVHEEMRLGHGFGNYDPSYDMLEMSIDVISKFTPAQDDKPATIQFNFLNKNEEYIPVFNFDYGMDQLSLIINRLAIFSNIPLQGALAEQVKSRAPYADDFFDATLKVHIRVKSADTENPIDRGHSKTYLMVGEVAYIRCEVTSFYTQQKEELWDYVAPWYEAAYKEKTMPEEEKYPHPFDLYKD